MLRIMAEFQQGSGQEIRSVSGGASWRDLRVGLRKCRAGASL